MKFRWFRKFLMSQIQPNSITMRICKSTLLLTAIYEKESSSYNFVECINRMKSPNKHQM